MLTRNRLHLDAFSLPAVVVVSALVMLLILFAISMRTLDFQYHDAYLEQKQERLDLHSAAALYMCDSTLLDGKDSVCVFLYGDGEDPIWIKRKPWGLYEVVSLWRTEDDPFAHTYLMGRAAESSCQAAFWISNRNTPLSLAGNTTIKGPAYIPQVGVKYLKIGEREFQGKTLEVEDLHPSQRFLPRLSMSLWQQLDSLKRLYDIGVDYHNAQGTPVSFGGPTALVRCNTHKEATFCLSGNVVLFGGRLVISKESDIHDIIIIARSVVIESGFRGSAQIICADSILVKPGARLDYPSGLFVDSSGQNAPCITMGENSNVTGYVGIHWGEKYHYVLENPCFRLRKNARVHGLVYVDGSCELEGAIKGAAYVKDCFYWEGHSIYTETLNDVSIERNDGLAFPILLDGPYKRKITKQVY